MSDTVGVRELRQNLSVYLRRVRAGERLVVTDRNIPVAELVPLVPADDPIARLVSEGRLELGRGRLSDLPPPIPVPHGDPYAGTRALQEAREDIV